MGQNANDLDGCFELSNPISVNRTICDDPVVPGSGTGCEVIETCGAITVKQSGTSIIIENVDGGQAIIQVFDPSWAQVHSCAWWGPACEGTTTIDGLIAGGTYYVRVNDCSFNITISGVDCDINGGGNPAPPPAPVCDVDGGNLTGGPFDFLSLIHISEPTRPY